MSASAAATVANAARKTTNFANQTVETARFDVLKEPLGFVKILQFALALLAFAIACNGSSAVFIEVICNSSSTTGTTGTTVSTTLPTSTSSTATPQTLFQVYGAQFGYPYDLTAATFSKVPNRGCSSSQTSLPLNPSTLTTSTYNIVSSAQFFVFVGVMSFLYSIAFTIIYIFFRHKYNNIVYFSLIDFGCTLIFAIFWFAGSIAWAKAVSDIQTYTNPDNYIASIPATCPGQDQCYPVYYPTYANIIVSCILGFGNLVLWVGDVWFVLKETSWYKTRRQMQQQQQQQVTNNPISINDVNITARYNPNDKI
jgi:hypothetical protein